MPLTQASSRTTVLDEQLPHETPSQSFIKSKDYLDSDYPLDRLSFLGIMTRC
jgi:hypothetical protein